MEVPLEEFTGPAKGSTLPVWGSLCVRLLKLRAPFILHEKVYHPNPEP